jgi:hypothetical protein
VTNTWFEGDTASMTDPNLSDSSAEIAALRAEVEALKKTAADAVARAAAVSSQALAQVVHNGAGIDLSVAPTWSAFDQELAQQGAHPLQTGGTAPWVG